MVTYRKPTPRRSANTGQARASVAPRIVALALGFVAIVALCSFALSTCIGKETASAPAPAPEASQEPRVSFVAVGDNLPETSIAEYADSLAGEVGDGAYDYAPIYEPIKPYIESADLAYIKQETHLGGGDIGPRGYPSFNTTDEMADAVVATGFDLVASATNHSYDWGYYGAVDHSLSVWESKPVVFTGTAANQEQADALALVERNGIGFALLDYTYGVNGYAQDELAPYSVNFIDEERIRADVARAKEAADVVLVAMHWGTENLLDADEDQIRWAQLLADLEVDVVLGSHPHVIGPMEWIQGENGNQTLVAYSLGNFLSHHETPDTENELEGMLSCDFVRGEDGKVRIENVAWTPLVNHSEEGLHRIYALKDYTVDLADRHRIFDDGATAIESMRATTREVIGDQFTIIDGA